MTGANGCEQTRELAAELALGVVDGEERARALEHLDRCPECRRAVDELSSVADEMLLLAPSREAPVGFEARALEPIRSPRAPKRRRRWVFGPLGAAAAGAAATLAIAFAIFGDDVRLANSYQNTLDRANGEKFEATSVYAPHDVEAGTLFGYQGKPSWLFVTVDSSFRAGVRRAELITTDGTRIPLPSFRLDPGTGSWGQALPVGLTDVANLRLLGGDRSPVLFARIKG